MRNYGLLIILGVIMALLLCGCGGGSGEGSMMLKITSPINGTTCKGNQGITATMLNPSMATTVLFKANGDTFATVTPDLTMIARLDTLSLGLPNGPVTVTVQTTGGISYTASQTLNVSNPRSIYVQDVSADAGDYVSVHVKLNDYATAAGYHIVLNYATSKLLLNAGSVAKGAGVPASALLTTDTSVQGRLEATVTGANTFASGDVLTASFQIKYPSPSGSINDITLSSASLSNSSGGALTAEAVTGSVTTN